MSVIAVTGATGYIGGRLVPLLLEQGHSVRVLTRRSNALRDVPWGKRVQIVEGDLTDPEAAAQLCEGATVLYGSSARGEKGTISAPAARQPASTCG